MEDYRKNRRYTAEKFAKLGDKNPYLSIEDLNNEYESESGIIRLINNIQISFGRTYTKEEFIKTFACDKDVFKNSQYCSSSPQPIDTIFSCVKNHYNRINKKVFIPSRPGFIVVFVDNFIWVFQKTKIWTQHDNKTSVVVRRGKWECIGSESFSIISNNQQWLSSDKLSWVDIAEPTPDKSSGGSESQFKNTNLTIEDLKSGETVSKGMRGSVIGEIQKLLIEAGYKDVSKSGEPDNLFGPLTKEQVEKFQSENKDDKGEQLKKDGIVGKKTITALLKLSSEKMKKSAQGEIPTKLRLAPKDFGKI